MIRDITIATVLVDDQDEALAFYVDRLGFEKRDDERMGDGDRWLTVSPADSEYPQLTLVAAADGVERDRVGSQAGDHVAFVLRTDDCRETYGALVERGVEFVSEPSEQPWGVEAVFEDLYGNRFDLLELRTPGE